MAITTSHTTLKAAFVFIMCMTLFGCGKQHQGRNAIKTALALRSLPHSVTNIQFGEDAWTDYVLHAYCELDPADFTNMMTGRVFTDSAEPIIEPIVEPIAISDNVSREEIPTGQPIPDTSEISTLNLNSINSIPISPPQYASSIPIFTANEIYYARITNFSGSCTLYTTKEHDRVYIVYSAD
jgi:hypothetical protein